jgi:hypothetical protein
MPIAVPIRRLVCSARSRFSILLCRRAAVSASAPCVASSVAVVCLEVHAYREQAVDAVVLGRLAAEVGPGRIGGEIADAVGVDGRAGLQAELDPVDERRHVARRRDGFELAVRPAADRRMLRGRHEFVGLLADDVQDVVDRPLR